MKQLIDSSCQLHLHPGNMKHTLEITPEKLVLATLEHLISDLHGVLPDSKNLLAISCSLEWRMDALQGKGITLGARDFA